MCNRVHQMRFAKANTTIKEQRVKRDRATFGNTAGSRMGQFVWFTHNESVKSKPGIKRGPGRCVTAIRTWCGFRGQRWACLGRDAELQTLLEYTLAHRSRFNDIVSLLVFTGQRKGEIAYLHPQFVPIRDNKFDWRKPVDGSDPATDWQGEHSLDQLPSMMNPGSGFAFNVNNWPWTAAGPDSPKQAAFSKYMDSAGENPRGPNALRLLSGDKKFDLSEVNTQIEEEK